MNNLGPQTPHPSVVPVPNPDRGGREPVRHICDSSCFTTRHHERVKGDAKATLNAKLRSVGAPEYHACSECGRPNRHSFHDYDCSHRFDDYTACGEYGCLTIHPGASHAEYIREHG